MQEDPILSKYIKNNLDCWKNKKLNENKLVKIIHKYKLSIIKLQIKNGNVKILNLFNANKQKSYVKKSMVFLKDIAKLYPSLNIELYLYVKDTLYNEIINIYNINGKKENPYNLNDFVWGVSQSNPNYIRIVDSNKIEEYNNSFPVFCFESHSDMNGILFPAFGGDNNHITKSVNIDNIDWNEKDIDIPIFRGINICCDVSNLDKIKLINLSYVNPDKTDFKFSASKIHPIWDKHIVSRSLLQFCQNTNIIDKNLNIDDVRNYFSKDNFVSFNYLFKHKFIVTVASAKNRKWYLSNSCVLEFLFKNKKFFHEDIFEDMEDIVYFNKNNLFERLNKLKEDNYKLSKKLIKNRKQKFNNYLHYPNLVKWYGLFLMNYQKLLNHGKSYHVESK